MKRTVLVVLAMVAGITLMIWAGWHNIRDRRLALQKAQENRIVLTPAKPGDKADKAEDDGGPPQMRGKIAPGFTLVSVDGRKVSLADFKGRPVLVNFWATWCGPCKLEMPYFEEFRAKYAAEGFEVLGIAEDDSGKDEIGRSAKKLGANYPILLTDGKVAPAYGGIEFLPMSFYVDRNGIIAEQTAGGASKDEVEANIRKILPTLRASAAGSD